MITVRKLVLACSALAPIALSTPALAALDSGLRGPILREDAVALKVAGKPQDSNPAMRSLDFAAAHSNGTFVDSLAPASSSPAYYATARQIANSMGFLGNSNGAGVIIGVVDTGVDLHHSEFLSATGASRILPGACFGGFSAASLCSTADNKIGGDDAVWPTVTHGTHVAGIAAGSTVGLASGASILPVRVCDSSTGACPGDIDGGIVWASQHGAKVINLSLGGTFLSSRDITSARTAVANGSLLVVAAGNSGTAKPVGGFLAGAALYDGVRGSLIVVGALDATNHIAYFSQTPGTTCLAQPSGTYCMQNYYVVAPGYAITSSVGGGGYATLSGTSMATPYVTGVAADIKGLWPYLTMPQVASIIFGTAIDLGAPGPDPVYGQGLVDLATALKPAGTTSVVTSGTTVTGSTTSTSGTTSSGTSTPPKSRGGMINSLNDISMSGALSSGFAHSSFLKTVVAVDSYGRSYSADLTKGVSTSGFDISGFVMLDQLLATSSAPGTIASGYQAVSTAGYTPQLGLVTMSGLVNTVTTPAVFANGPASRDVVQGYMSNLAISASPSEDVTFDMGYKLRLAGRINEYDANSSQAYSGLFLSASAVNSPYASLTDGGNYIGTTIKVADNIDVRTAFSWLSPNGQQTVLPANDLLAYYDMHHQTAPFEQRDANAAVMSVSWNFASWGGLGVVASQTDEHNGVLGGTGSGAFNVASSANTSAVDATMRVALAPNWLATVSYGEGLTRLDLQPDGILSSASSLRSRSYGIAVATRDVLGDDSLGFALSRPMHIYDGNGTLTAATAVDDAGNLTISHAAIGFAEAAPETDVEVGYSRSFMEGRLALQTDAAYQMDVGGQSGRDAATFITRLKFGL